MDEKLLLEKHLKKPKIKPINSRNYLKSFYNKKKKSIINIIILLLIEIGQNKN